MKKLFTLTILILQLSFVFAQNRNISKFWGNPSIDENGPQVFEVNSNAFFITVQRDYFIGNFYAESILLKLDSNCKIIDSLKLINYNKRGKKYLLYSFLNYNNRIIGKGYAYDSVSLKSQIWISEFDEDLTILYDTIIENSDATAQLFNCNILKTTQNKLLITSQYHPALHDSINTVVWLLDTNFNIIEENEFNTDVSFLGFSVVELPSNQSFHIITPNKITQINSNDLSNDTIIWKLEYEWSQWEGIGGSKTINDSTYIQPRIESFETDWDLKSGYRTYLYTRNKDGIIKDSITIGNMQKSFYKTSYNNFVYFTLDSIFVTGANYSLDSSWYSCEDNTIFLWNISLSGNINWQKYYSMNRKIIVADIKKTSDGGCFMIGTAWDWHHYQQYTNDIFFLKVDRNGNVCGSLGVNEIITQSEILVYPNPAKDNLNFDMGMYKDFQLSVYNQLGQTIMQKNFTSGSNTINIGNFKPGIYFYNLQNKNGKVISGKFVKE